LFGNCGEENSCFIFFREVSAVMRSSNIIKVIKSRIIRIIENCTPNPEGTVEEH
jgi:hypothetical protein